MNMFCCEIINILGFVDQMISVTGCSLLIQKELPPAIYAQTGDCALKILSIQELVTFSCNKELFFILFFQSFTNTKIYIINTYFGRWGAQRLAVLPWQAPYTYS